MKGKLVTNVSESGLHIFALPITSIRLLVLITQNTFLGVSRSAVSQIMLYFMFETHVHLKGPQSLKQPAPGLGQFPGAQFTCGQFSFSIVRTGELTVLGSTDFRDRPIDFQFQVGGWILRRKKIDQVRPGPVPNSAF